MDQEKVSELTWRRKVMNIKKVVLFVYIVVILLLVVLPLNDKVSFINDTYVVDIRLDYLSHVFLFLPFLFLLRLAYPTIVISWIILTGIVFAGLCEGMQYLLPYRSFNVNDLLANSIGIVIGILLLRPAIVRFLGKTRLL